MENIYCRYLDIPVEYTPKYPNIDSKEFKHLILQNTDVSEEIHSWFKSLNLEFVKGAIFHLPPFFVVTPHIDIPVLKNQVAKLNWVYSDAGNFMEWFKPNPGTILKKKMTDINRESFYMDASDCHKVFEAKMDRSALVNVGELHGTHNGSSNTWYFCVMIKEIGSNKLLEWPRALEIFEKFYT